MGNTTLTTQRTKIQKASSHSRVSRHLIPITLILFSSAFILIVGTEAGGTAWREEGSVTSREYRDITLTDLEGDGSFDVGGILRELEGGDPSAEFYTYSDGSWSLFPSDIAYKGIYNDLAASGPYIAAAHSGGNSADAWFYNSGTGQFEFREPDEDSVTENYSLCVEMGDLNNDTYPDIVAGFNTQGIKVFYGTPEGGWEQGDFPSTEDVMVKAILIADLDNDSNMDIINTYKPRGGDVNDPKKIEVWMGDGTGNWLKKTVVSDKNVDYSTLACAPLNDDGYLDLIAASDIHTGIDRYIFQPVGSFWERSQIFSKGSYYSLSLEDVNEDTIPDIVGGRFDDKGINIFLGDGDGDGNFDPEDFGPVQNGNVWATIIHDFDGDGHADILAANRTGMYFWIQALPEIKNVVIPETMYAMYDFYNLSLEVSSEALYEDPDHLESVKLRFEDNGTLLFTLAYSSDRTPGNEFYVEQGSGLVNLDVGNSSRTDLDDGKIRIQFSIMPTWTIRDIGSQIPGTGTIHAYMKEEQGTTTGWEEIQGISWQIISSISVQEFQASDVTLNPGDQVSLWGTIYYSDPGGNLTLPPRHIPENILDRVLIHADGLDDSTDWDIVNGSFAVNITLPLAPQTGDFTFWPEVVMDRGELPYSFLPFPEVNITVRSDYLIVELMWVTGETYYDLGTQTYWQRSGESLTFHTHVEYQYSGNVYDGEFSLTNGTSDGSHAGSNVYPTIGRNVDLTFTREGLMPFRLVPLDDSAFSNEYGPMLRSNITSIPDVVWDGEAPIILDFTQESLINGSEIKAVDALVAILVSEYGLMEPFESRSFGTITIFWSIIQDENNSFNGSAVMERSWTNDNYTFSYNLPISLAKTDDVVLFWFRGNDTVGNEFLSDLWPVRGTDEDPVTVLVDPMPPAPPTGLYTNVGDGYIEVRWKPNQEDDLAGYKVYRSTDGVTFSNSPISGLDFVAYNYFEDKGLQNGKTYYYRISAVDRAVIPNESNLSDIVSDKPEEDKASDIQTLVMDNILYVFVFAVVIAIVVQGFVIARKSRGESESASPSTTTPFSGTSSQNAFPSTLSSSSSSHYTGSQISPEQSHPSPPTPSTSHRKAVKQPKRPASSTPTSPQVPAPTQPTGITPGQNFPPIDWTCPSCTKEVALLQGERFCKNCGYKIR